VDAHNLVDEDRKELNMAYAFEGVDIAKPEGYSLLHFKEVFSRWDSAFAKNGWLSIFLSNHDQARMVSRFGNDSPKFRELSSKMLTTFIMTMRGTPYYYNGDELGMTNAGFSKIEDYNDMPAMNEYQNVLKNGGDIPKFIESLKFGSRANGRTPFQWNDSKNAGFSTGNPWIKVNPNYTKINVINAEKDPNSTLNYFKKIVQFRKKNPVLTYGKYTLLDKQNPNVYAYTRELAGKKMLVMLNFSDKDAKVNVGINTQKAILLLKNYSTGAASKLTNQFALRPYEVVIYGL
jgi:oligo-1,6-glucosidase